jgi:hypothetical protein
MSNKRTTLEDPWTASRRRVLAGGVGIGIAAAAAAVTAAAGHANERRGGGDGRSDTAHGGAIHTQVADPHGGIDHVHDGIGHTHAVMAHPLDEQTLRNVDVGDRQTDTVA